MASWIYVCVLRGEGEEGGRVKRGRKEEGRGERKEERGEQKGKREKKRSAHFSRLDTGMPQRV